MLMYQMAWLMVLEVKYVVHVVTNNDHAVTSVLVRFDNEKVGLKTIQLSPYHHTFPCTVLLAEYENVFLAKEK